MRDHVSIDPSSSNVVAPTAEGEVLAAGCWGALHGITQIYEVREVRVLFVYTMTRGIHTILSVDTHTDEGGIIVTSYVNGDLRSQTAWCLSARGNIMVSFNPRVG